MNAIALHHNPLRTLSRLMARFAVALDLATLPLGLVLSCLRVSARGWNYRSNGLVLVSGASLTLAVAATLLAAFTGSRRIPRSCRFALILSTLALALCCFGGAP